MAEPQIWRQPAAAAASGAQPAHAATPLLRASRPRAAQRTPQPPPLPLRWRASPASTQSNAIVWPPLARLLPRWCRSCRRCSGSATAMPLHPSTWPRWMKLTSSPPSWRRCRRRSRRCACRTSTLGPARRARWRGCQASARCLPPNSAAIDGGKPLTDKATAAAEAAALAALPLSRLTSLGLKQLPRAPLQSLALTALRELTGGVQLPCERLRELAGGLPQLRLLSARPIGEWGPTDAVFACVEAAAFEEYIDTSFAAHVRLAQLFPALVRLELNPWPSHPRESQTAYEAADAFEDFKSVKLPNLAGLTGLSSLRVSVGADTAPPPPLRREHIAAIASMAALRELQCAVRPWRITALTALSALTGLTSLDLAIADGELEWTWEHEEGDEWEDGWEDDQQSPPDVDGEDGEDALTRRRTLSDVLQAAAHLPALRTLGLVAREAKLFGAEEAPEEGRARPAAPRQPLGPHAAPRTLVIYGTRQRWDLAKVFTPFAGAPLTRVVLRPDHHLSDEDVRRCAQELAPLGVEVVGRKMLDPASEALGFPRWRCGEWWELYQAA
ncbi:hypothetical protein Rsub_05408 [Raphidocelis subcapitata]|uniref:Uncharacterized protein n=1 Tax=Raphidocelis subcapitata TaxID=307507 RepID=A0A2V0NZN8_9CHLO|nr:hypothetical protein Rsub_05408 [Raphidocelis subcapitata]|eukprot:GBF92789.1 hypothetical protein Rsub_05408 [Raphidocelis subcapitata]